MNFQRGRGASGVTFQFLPRVGIKSNLFPHKIQSSWFFILKSPQVTEHFGPDPVDVSQGLGKMELRLREDGNLRRRINELAEKWAKEKTNTYLIMPDPMHWCSNPAFRRRLLITAETRKGEREWTKRRQRRSTNEAKRPMGVYRIRNNRNHKSYVGFDRDLSARIHRHKAELKFGSHRNRELQEEWNWFGEASFQFEVLDKLDHKETSQKSPIEELQVLAEIWIQKLEKAGDSVVNLQPAAAPKTGSPSPATRKQVNQNS